MRFTRSEPLVSPLGPCRPWVSGCPAWHRLPEGPDRDRAHRAPARPRPVARNDGWLADRDRPRARRGRRERRPQLADRPSDRALLEPGRARRAATAGQPDRVALRSRRALALPDGARARIRAVRARGATRHGDVARGCGRRLDRRPRPLHGPSLGVAHVPGAVPGRTPPVAAVASRGRCGGRRWRVHGRRRVGHGRRTLGDPRAHAAGRGRPAPRDRPVHRDRVGRRVRRRVRRRARPDPPVPFGERRRPAAAPAPRRDDRSDGGGLLDRGGDRRGLAGGELGLVRMDPRSPGGRVRDLDRHTGRHRRGGADVWPVRRWRRRQEDRGLRAPRCALRAPHRPREPPALAACARGYLGRGGRGWRQRVGRPPRDGRLGAPTRSHPRAPAGQTARSAPRLRQAGHALRSDGRVLRTPRRDLRHRRCAAADGRDRAGLDRRRCRACLAPRGG